MRYAILSDIHGNLEALQAVVEACRHQGVRQFLCTGDTVGYGANPKECLDFLQKYNIPSVAGNHDWAIGGRLNVSYFTDNGKAAVAWSQANLPFEYFDYLNTLKAVLKNDKVILVHASLNHPERFDYLSDIAKAADTFSLMDSPLCFIGHTHVPKIFVQQEDAIFDLYKAEVEINPDHKYIVNTGSVGQPRDGNPLASYGIYDTDLEMVELKRVSYDIEKAQRKILDAGLPERLASRLNSGK